MADDKKPPAPVAPVKRPEPPLKADPLRLRAILRRLWRTRLIPLGPIPAPALERSRTGPAFRPLTPAIRRSLELGTRRISRSSRLLRRTCSPARSADPILLDARGAAGHGRRRDPGSRDEAWASDDGRGRSWYGR
jgi:hypothetical protein